MVILNILVLENECAKYLTGDKSKEVRQADNARGWPYVLCKGVVHFTPYKDELLRY